MFAFNKRNLSQMLDLSRAIFPAATAFVPVAFCPMTFVTLDFEVPGATGVAPGFGEPGSAGAGVLVLPRNTAVKFVFATTLGIIGTGFVGAAPLATGPATNQAAAMNPSRRCDEAVE